MLSWVDWSAAGWAGNRLDRNCSKKISTTKSHLLKNIEKDKQKIYDA